MDYRVWLHPLAFVTLLSFAQAKRNFIVDLHNFTCIIVDPSFGKELTCIIHKSRPNPVISARFMLAKTEKEFNIHFILDIVKSDESVIKMGNSKLDGCKYLSSLYGNNIYGKFFRRIQKVSNLPRKCPIPGNKLYEIRNYSIDVDEYPPAVPELTFRLTLKIMRGDHVVAIIFFIASTIY
ncbi:uncharacterized protein LOC111605723 [Drosophila hydei]|uniref:Uncharacterized protein LOC111605723 n=1 Tax=Drosophila hydei TaxID=7224 RepID=A0A6J1MLP4_DROHY|nr:uncharacterized protein LOC111605723 [Drosophila hydei]